MRAPFGVSGSENDFDQETPAVTVRKKSKLGGDAVMLATS